MYLTRYLPAGTCLPQVEAGTMGPNDKRIAFFVKNATIFLLGEVAEWSKAPVSKTGMPQGIVGSNPTLSATSRKDGWEPSARIVVAREGGFEGRRPDRGRGGAAEIFSRKLSVTESLPLRQ